MTSNQTPGPTPVKAGPHRKLPMIVDIAIDNNGKQLYQVHESSKLVRKEMPKSTSFHNNSLAEVENLDSDEEKTPIRKILGTISPSTLNQKKYMDSEEEFLPPDPAPRKSNIFEELSSSDPRNDLDKDIWSKDVEAAFEEVLSIIPKNGLNKIKISGRSCGRNELISDFILTKTGKFRSRKQVSSHIQVIKNLGQKTNIIKLINEGPAFTSKEEQELNNKKFEEIFSKINLNKSLGFNDTSSPSSSSLKRKSSSGGSSSKKHRPNATYDVGLENFFISVHGDISSSPIIFSYQNHEGMKVLKLRENAVISNRFPGLGDFQNSNIPIVHNMVRLQIPSQLPYNYNMDSGLKTNMFVKCTEAGTQQLTPETLSVFTSIYSHGNEVLKMNDTDFKFNENTPFLLKFWRFFFKEIMSKPNTSIDALKGVTIKQIIFSGTGNVQHQVPKLNIKAVLLWEFAQVADLGEAITSSTKLILPEKFATLDDTAIAIGASDKVIPQEVAYNPSGADSIRITPSTASTMAMPNTAATSTTTLTVPESAHLLQMGNAQRKFPAPMEGEYLPQYPTQFQYNQFPLVNTDLMVNEPQEFQFNGMMYPDYGNFQDQMRESGPYIEKGPF